MACVNIFVGFPVAQKYSCDYCHHERREVFLRVKVRMETGGISVQEILSGVWKVPFKKGVEA
jgi:hypothetical protein